jgi:hypothetical protein
MTTFQVRPAVEAAVPPAVLAEDCRICGRLVLPVTGWTTEIPAERNLVVNWRTGPAEFAGRLHHACLRSWEHRAAYRDALETLLRCGDITLSYEVGGRRRQARQRGFHYPDEIFAGGTCQILQSDRSDSWMVLSEDGTLHCVSYPLLQRIAAGKPAQVAATVERSRLNVVPTGTVEADTWPVLLDHLDLTDRYAGTLDAGTTYSYVGFDPIDTTLEYAIATTLPLPAEAVSFLRDYADEYLPVDPEARDSADAWDRVDGWDDPEV